MCESSSQSYLQNYLLMDGKFCNDVCQKQVPAVFAGRVHARLGQEARPSKRHQAAQLAVAVLVVVVDVVRSVLHQKRGKLQEVDPEGIQHIRLLFRIQYLLPGVIKEERGEMRKTEQENPPLLSIKAKS